MYSYNANVLKVVDADTLWLRVDLGLDCAIRISTRLHGINAPEMSTEEGKAAKAFLEEHITEGSLVHIKTIKDRREKYGRYLVEIYTMPEMVNLNILLVESGHAVVYP